MLETILVILLVLWLLGMIGGSRIGVPPGNAIHTLIVIVVILLILRLLGIL